mgnify:CR=1 FL=1
MKQNTFDIVVVGGGHAGIEAALISTKLKKKTLIVTMDPLAIGRMSCNPAIGGIAKGQMVREIDVLGGKMASVADRAGIQFKTLNKKKGRAVWSPRAQIDKRLYEQLMLSEIKTSDAQIVSGEVVRLNYSGQEVCGVVLRDGTVFGARAVIVTAGTFLSGLIHIGERKIRAGRMGEERSEGLTEDLCSFGFRSGRLKTGTPPRLNKDSINWDKTTIDLGDEKPTPFSYSTEEFTPPNTPCHTLPTNKTSHDIIKNNQESSPMFSGDISGAGPRYCPSIEDKIHRFPKRDSHLLFLEPEWLGSDQIYLNGFSTSLPEDIQVRSLRKINGLESVELFRPGYAIEYDFFPPSQLKNTLETKDVGGLYFAGQMNGTSGYEEAAAQGLIAGANAALKILNKDPLILDRSMAYIGVLIDDLITKDIDEPYRMFTSRAEHRLSLRPDNATLRLSSTANRLGLINTKKYLASQKFKTSIDEIKSLCKKTRLIINNKNVTFFNYLKRPEGTINNKTIEESFVDAYSERELFTAETDIKYEGYVNIENQRVKKLKKLESTKIPLSFNYKLLSSLSTESKEKLARVRPETLGQASRISGVKPSDISLLAIMLKADA